MRRVSVLPVAAGLLILSGLIASPARASHFSHIVNGRILLDVERNGEAWYVSPVDFQRYYLGRPEDALRLVRTLGLGISDRDLAGIPTSGEAFAGNLNLRRRLSGRILLQVEAHGEAWYVNPTDLKRYYLGQPRDALRVMQRLSLGISARDLSHIPAATAGTDAAVGGVPFLAQAPTGEWNDLRQQEGCEEASALMAVAWAQGIELTPEEGRQAIIDISDWEKERYGYFVDTSVQDTADRIFREYFGYRNIATQFDIDTEDIRRQLEQGRIVLVTINGQAIGNPNFRGGGPLRHMIVVIGYDAAADEFIAHDPGTSRGENYRYSRAALQSSLRDYPSGNNVPLDDRPTAMIVVSR